MSISKEDKSRGVYFILYGLLWVLFIWKLYPFNIEHPGVLTPESATTLTTLVVSIFFWWKAFRHVEAIEDAREGEDRRLRRYSAPVVVATVATAGLFIGAFMYSRHIMDVTYLTVIVVIFLALVVLGVLADLFLDWMSDVYADGVRSWKDRSREGHEPHDTPPDLYEVHDETHQSQSDDSQTNGAPTTQ